MTFIVIAIYNGHTCVVITKVTYIMIVTKHAKKTLTKVPAFNKRHSAFKHSIMKTLILIDIILLETYQYLSPSGMANRHFLCLQESIKLI